MNLFYRDLALGISAWNRSSFISFVFVLIPNISEWLLDIHFWTPGPNFQLMQFNTFVLLEQSQQQRITRKLQRCLVIRPTCLVRVTFPTCARPTSFWRWSVSLLFQPSMLAVSVTLPLLQSPCHCPELQQSGIWGRAMVDLSEAVILFDSLINVSLPVLMMPIFPNPLIEPCKKKNNKIFSFLRHIWYDPKI